MSAPADPRLGTRLAGYQITSLLGRGGMGVVYLAEQLGPHRQVALKLLVDPAAASQGFRERFLRESELAAAIDHPNVLPVYDAGETDGVLWIAMRYVDGIDLAALLEREGPLAPNQALAIGRPVAGALDAAHARGLVHRDVKPANILLAMEGGAVAQVYLADFGLTRRIGGARGLTVSGQVLGTIDYVAPEQVEGGPVDGRADQYSLGCVLFECLTGVVPFRRDSELAVLWAHVHDPPPRLRDQRPELPAALDDAIDRALAKAPGDRYPSCGALAAAAQAALAGTAPVGARHRVRRRAGRRAGRGSSRLTRRSSLLLTVTAGVLSAVLVAAAVLLARDGGALAVPTTPAVPPAASSAVRIDPGTLRAEAVVPVGTDPLAVVAGGGLVWVANRRDGTVTVIDPGTNRVQETIPPSGSLAGWPGRPRPCLRQRERLDPQPRPGAGRPRRTRRGTDPHPDGREPQRHRRPAGRRHCVGGGPDPERRRPARPHRRPHQPGRPDDPAAPRAKRAGGGRGRGTVWTVTTKDRTLRSFDTRTGDPGKPVKLRLAPDQVVLGDGAVWVTSSSRDTVLRIDPATSKAKPIRVGNGPGGIAFGADRVWVTNGQDGTVSAIDPQTNEVATRRLGFRPAAVAVVAEQRAVWVALAA